MEHYEKGTAVCAGYLDMTAKGFPELQTTSLGNQINYFIMTEEACEKLTFLKKLLIFLLTSKQEKTMCLSIRKLSRLIQKENKDSGTMDTFYLNANYTLLESETKQNSKQLISCRRTLCLHSGDWNFELWEYIVSAFAVRRREFAIMQSLGLTRGSFGG